MVSSWYFFLTASFTVGAVNLPAVRLKTTLLGLTRPWPGLESRVKAMLWSL